MHAKRRWRTSRSHARSSRVHHASYPVFVHRPAASDWASSRLRLATTPLPFSLPSALRIPGHRTRTYEVTRHARRTRRAKGRRAFAPSRLSAGLCDLHIDFIVQFNFVAMHALKPQLQAGLSSQLFLNAVNLNLSQYLSFCGKPCRHCKAGDSPCATPFLCDPFTPGGLRYSYRAGALGAQGRRYHDDVHPCPEQRRSRYYQPAGYVTHP